MSVGDEESVRSRWLSVFGDRAALLFFVAVLLAALGLLLWWGRGGWFTFDDWDLLARRTAGSPHDIFFPHYDHWLTLPILLYRFLWWTDGLRSYFPYQVIVVVLHLTAAVLLRAVMRRAGCAAWLSTTVAGTFLFFGTAADTILVGFFMVFIASLVFGLAHLLLADHDGPFDRRDWLGLAAGLAGMLCSGIAVIMVMVVGLATLVRGWRIALMHTAPLAAVYLVWRSAIGTRGKDLPVARPTISQMARFVVVGLRAAFAGIGRLPGSGLALVVVIIVGSVLARARLGPLFRHRAALPLALLAGAPILLAIIATGRAGERPFGLSGGGPEYARQGRYVYLVAAMILPAFAFAADAIFRRWRLVGAAVVLLPILGLPANVRDMRDFRRTYVFVAGERQRILLPPRVPLASALPRSVEPEPFIAPGVTLGWLLDGVRSGRIPEPRPATPDDVATTTLKMAIAETAGPALAANCKMLHRTVQQVIQREQTITVKRGTLVVVYRAPTGGQSRAIRFHVSHRSGTLTLVALAGPLLLLMTPGAPNTTVCT